MGEPRLPPFEVEGRGLVSRFVATVLEVCRGPLAFYEGLEPTEVRGITLFAWLCTFIGTALGAAINVATLPWVRTLSALPEDVMGELQTAEILARSSLILSPIIALFAVHLVAGLLHISTRPFAKESAPYGATYRFVVYAFAPIAFMWIPVVGLVAVGFFFAVLTLGMRRLLGLGRLESVFGVVLPVLALVLTWSGVIQPRLAPELVERLWPLESPAETPPKPAPNVVDEEPLPPLPDPGRSHEVELFKDEPGTLTSVSDPARVLSDSVTSGPALYSERFTTLSQGELRVRHRAARAGDLVTVCVELSPRRDGTFTKLVARADLIAGLSASDVVDAKVRLDDEAFTLAEGAIAPWGYRERLAPGETFALCFDLKTAKTPREILQLGPTVGRLP